MVSTASVQNAAAGLRQEIDRLIAGGESAAASRLLADLWRQEKGAASAGFVTARFEKLRPALSLLPYRVALLRSFTVEPLVPMLRAGGFCAGMDLEVHLGEFNAYAQEMLDSASPLYALAADVAILAVQTRDVAPDLWRDFAGLTVEDRKAAALRVIRNYRDWVRKFREHSQAHLIIHSLEEPEAPTAGLLDAQSESSQPETIRHINGELRALAREYRGVYILDYDALVARHGRTRWHDHRKWLTMRMPIANQGLIELSEEWLRFLHPLTGKIAKALVVDLDNTLWGGVIGEDGMTGIQLGAEHPGAAYQELQRTILDLCQRGVILAVCSKNNPDDAKEALENHPEMVLKPSHFACMRVNWNDKAQNLREIAEELNIGVNALAFLDDNPVEREHVRAQLPEVHVIELPRDPGQYAHTLRQSPVFERLALTKEDLQRGQYYFAQRQRVELEQTCSSREDFYRYLQQEVEIAPVKAATVARVAQLTQKTNQFNLTTIRYSEQQITAMMNDPAWYVAGLRVTDRYGDNGLVGVAILEFKGDICDINELLMSCRVIGRTVETALLSHLAQVARSRGARCLQGRFIPTRKNAPAKDFYSSHGFARIAQTETESLWELDLSKPGPARPEWIRLVQ